MRTQRNGKLAASKITAATTLLAVTTTIVLTSCTGLRPLKGGRAVTGRAASGRIEQTLAQGDNASQPTHQEQETVKIRSYTLPASSRIVQASPNVSLGNLSKAETARDQAGLPALSVLLSAPMPVTEREEIRARTELGAAQKDTARELGAKLASLRGITWTGLALFIFGAASLVWSPLRAVIGSVTTSAAIALGGLALMILPTLIVGNELLILGGVVLSTGAWFLAHRHGQLRGQLSAAAETPALPSPEIKN